MILYEMAKLFHGFYWVNFYSLFSFAWFQCPFVIQVSHHTMSIKLSNDLETSKKGYKKYQVIRARFCEKVFAVWGISVVEKKGKK